MHALQYLPYLLLICLLVSSTLVVGWALFADRSRSKARCPKCGYPMAHIYELPTSPRLGPCPECGDTHRNTRDLFRTRRHWKVAFFGFCAMFAASAGLTWYHIHRAGWGWVWNASPDIALIYLLPVMPHPTRQAGFWRPSSGTYWYEVQARCRVFPSWSGGPSRSQPKERFWATGGLSGIESQILRARATELIHQYSSPNTTRIAAYLLALSGKPVILSDFSTYRAEVVVAQSLVAHERLKSILLAAVSFDDAHFERSSPAWQRIREAFGEVCGEPALAFIGSDGNLLLAEYPTQVSGSYSTLGEPEVFMADDPQSFRVARLQDDGSLADARFAGSDARAVGPYLHTAFPEAAFIVGELSIIPDRPWVYLERVTVGTSAYHVIAQGPRPYPKILWIDAETMLVAQSYSVCPGVTRYHVLEIDDFAHLSEAMSYPTNRDASAVHKLIHTMEQKGKEAIEHIVHEKDVLPIPPNWRGS